MRRAAQRAQARRTRSGIARDIPIPLPTKGMFAEAKTAEVSGLFAADLMNWRSTGLSLELRQQFTVDPDLQAALHHIPFEFGDIEDSLVVLSDRIRAQTDDYVRAFSTPFDLAYLSSNGVIVDGTASPVLFSGRVFSEGQFTTDTGMSANIFDGVISHHDRLFFWKEGDALDFYYGGVGAITGQVVRFPLGRLGNVNGTICCLKAMTVDAGHGMNDALAIFTSTGGIVVYEGLDPGSAQDWRLLTRLKVAPPISKRAFVEVGSDLWMLTASGVVSVSETIRNSSLALVNTVSRPIQKSLIAQIEEGGEWSMHLSADARSIIINRVFNGAASQFIYRTENKTWFTANFPARYWHNLGRKTQFTTLDGELATFDASGTEPITANWVSSWFRLPRSAGLASIQPTIIAKGPLELKVTILTDHNETSIDLAEAVQVITIEPDDPADVTGQVSLDEIIAVDAVGEVFQIRLEVTAAWAEIVNMKASVI